MRVLKWIGLLLATVLVLLVAAVVLLPFIIDPNDFKAEISALVKESSGYELTLEGDLSWSFYPVLGFQSESVTLSADASKPPLLNLRKLALGVELMPLFDAQLKVDQLQLEGVNAQLLVDKTGQGNWQLPAAADSTAASPTDPKAAPPADPHSGSASDPDNQLSRPLPELSIPLIRIVDSSIRYRDTASASDIGVTIDSLELRNVQLKEPIEWQLKGSVVQQNGPSVQLALDGMLLPNLEQQLYQLAPFNIKARVEGLLTAPLSVAVQSDIAVDLAQEQATIKLTSVNVADMQLQGEVQVNAFSTQPTFQGALQSHSIDVPALMALLDVPKPQTASSSVLKTLSLAVSFNGGTEQLRVPSLALQLDSSKLNGSLAITDFERQALTFDLHLDQINLDDYLPPVVADEGDKPAVPPASAEQAATELLPIELLRTLNLDGQLRLDSVRIKQEDITNIAVAIRARNGLVEVTRMQAQLLGGTVDGHVSIDAHSTQPQLASVLKVTGVELTSISSRFMTDSLLSGKASFDLDTTATGNTTDAILNSALGQMNLQLNEGVLHGVNINSIVVNALHDQLGKFEALFPQYPKYLPKELRTDTDISKLLASARLENGQLIMPRFEFFTGESGIDASGKLDLLKQGFDYDFGVVLSAVERNKYLKGTRWPVRCQGDLSGAPADWCRPDTKKMGSILQKAGGMALKDKTASELGDKVGLDAADQQQLEAELKEKAKEEEERAKRKLQQKLDKWLKKQ